MFSSAPKLLWLIAFTASTVFVSSAHADLIINIDKIVARAGETAIVNVYASSTTGTDVISGFNLPIDFNNDGFVDLQSDGRSDLPVGFTFDVSPITGRLYVNTDLDTPSPQIQLINVDAIATGSGLDKTLSQSTVLFKVGFKIDSSVPAGTVMPIQIIQPAAPFQSLLNVSSPSGSALTFLEPGIVARGSITIAAVPEPASAVLIPTIFVLLSSWVRPIRTNDRLPNRKDGTTHSNRL